MRLALLGTSAVLALYLFSYVVLSRTGGWVVAESGEFRLFLLASNDIYLWQPRYGSCQWFRSIGGDYGLRGDALGYFYSPLILADQRWFHRTIRFLLPDGSLVDPQPAPPYAEYHPLRQNRFAGRFPYTQAGP